MTLGPGDAEVGPDNRPRGADQCLYVVSGTGVAVVIGDRDGLREGTLVVVQRLRAARVFSARRLA